MQILILIIHVLIGLVLIGLVLIQHGKGADAGAAFGSGASGTVFGARGAASFLQKLTGWLVVAFFATSLLLAYVINASHNPTSVVDSVPAPKTEPASTVPNSAPSSTVPATPGAAEQGKPADVPSTVSGEQSPPGAENQGKSGAAPGAAVGH
ncbi:preprotein translocase subunit SecG [Halothiobacillus sp. DCM-1]